MARLSRMQSLPEPARGTRGLAQARLPGALLALALACGWAACERLDGTGAPGGPGPASAGGAAPGPAPVDPLRPAGLDALDADVAGAIRAALAALEAAPDDPQAWGRLGMVYHANQLPRLAVEAYDRALERDPSDGKQLYRRALSLLDLGQESAAIEALERSAGLLPGATVIPWRLGTLHLERGELELARVAFAESIERNPGFVPARLGLARVHLLFDENEQAIALLEGVLAEIPRHRHANELLRTARRQAGLADEDPGRLRGSTFEPQAYDPWEEEVLTFRAESRVARAIRLLSRDKADRALPLLEAERAEGRVDITVLGNLAEAYVALGREAEAREALQAALALAPENVRFHSELAQLCEQAGERQRAIELLERAIGFAPERAELHRQLGSLLFASQRLEEGTRALREAQRLDGRDPRSWTRLGYAELALGRRDAAREAFERAVAFEPPPSDALLALAEMHLDEGRLGPAEAELARVADGARVDRARLEALRLRAAAARAAGAGADDAGDDLGGGAH